MIYMGLGCLFGHLFHSGHGHSHNGQNEESNNKHYHDSMECDNHNENEDVLNLLKRRFVKGEISEDEFNKMKKVILEN